MQRPQSCTQVFLILLVLLCLSAPALGNDLKGVCGGSCSSVAESAPWPYDPFANATPLTTGGLTFRVPGNVKRLGYLNGTATVALSDGRTVGITVEKRSDLEEQYRYLKHSSISVHAWVHLIFDERAVSEVAKHDADPETVRETMRLKPTYFDRGSVVRYAKGPLTVYRIDRHDGGHPTLIAISNGAPQRMVTVVLKSFDPMDVDRFIASIEQAR